MAADHHSRESDTLENLRSVLRRYAAAALGR